MRARKIIFPACKPVHKRDATSGPISRMLASNASRIGPREYYARLRVTTCARSELRTEANDRCSTLAALLPVRRSGPADRWSILIR